MFRSRCGRIIGFWWWHIVLSLTDLVLTIIFRHLDYGNFRSLFLLTECFVPCFLFSLWSSGLSGQKFWWLMSLQVHTVFPWEFCRLWLLLSCLFVSLEVSLTPVKPDCSSVVPSTSLAWSKAAVAVCSNGMYCTLSYGVCFPNGV